MLLGVTRPTGSLPQSDAHGMGRVGLSIPSPAAARDPRAAGFPLQSLTHLIEHFKAGKLKIQRVEVLEMTIHLDTHFYPFHLF